MSEEKKLYTTPDAAKEIGISANHLRNLIRTGKATPAQQIGGTWLFTAEEIERLRHRKRKPGPEKKAQVQP